MFVACAQAWAVCRWDPHACAPLSCLRSCGSMKCCQEMKSNEGMYSCSATQKENDWLAQGLCLTPFLCRRDWRHHAGSCLARLKKVKIAEEKVMQVSNLLRFQPTHTCVSREDSCLFYWSSAITNVKGIFKGAVKRCSFIMCRLHI